MLEKAILGFLVPVVGSLDPKLHIDLIIEPIVPIVPQIPTKFLINEQISTEQGKDIIGLQKSL